MSHKTDITYVATFYLSVEIHNVRQLQKIKPSLMSSMDRSLLSLFESRGLQQVYAEPGIYLLALRSGDADLTELTDAAFAVHRYLASQRDELSGFLLYIHVSDAAEAQQVLREIRQKTLSVEEEEVMLVSEDAAGFLDKHLTMERARGYWIAENQAVPEPSILGEAAAFCRRPELSIPIQDALDRFWNEDWQPGVLLIHGPRFSGKRYNFEYAAEQLLGPDLPDPYLDLFPGKRQRGAYAPFVNSLRTWNLKDVPANLSRHEMESWEQRKGLFDLIQRSQSPGICPDSLQRDFHVMYGLIVQSFVRRMEDLLLPAFIVCNELHTYGSRTLEALAGLFERFLGSNVFMPVLISQKPYLPPELRNFPFSKLRIPIMEDESLARLSQTFLSAGESEGIPVEEIRKRTGGSVGAMFYMFHNQRRSDTQAATGGAIERIPPPLREAWRFVAAFDAPEKIVLYAAMLTWEIIEVEPLARALGDLDISQARAADILESLASLGLVRMGPSPRPTIPELEAALRAHLGKRAREIRTALAGRLYLMWQEGEMGVSQVLFELSHGILRRSDELIIYRALVRGLLDRREFSEAYRLLYQSCPYTISVDDAGEGRLVAATVLGLRLRLALLADDQHGAELAYIQAEEVNPEPETLEIGDLLLQEARYAWAHGDGATAMNLIKRSILVYQDAGDRRGLAAAHTEFGLVTLAAEQLGDAREYFVIAGKSVEREESVYEYVRAHTLEAVGFFIHGGMTGVNERTALLYEIAESAGMREWALFHRFIHARALFELGRYEEAGREFEFALTYAQVYQNSTAYSVLLAWLARCLSYTGRPGRAVETLRGIEQRRETRFFEAEALIIQEKFAEAIEPLEAAISVPDPVRIRSDEAMHWKDGFSDMEDLAVGTREEGTVLLHLSKAFHAYALAHMGHRIEGIAEMHRLTREERASPLDPYNHLYFYLYGAILPDARDANRDPSFEDKLTVLGKAVKNMQERLSRMDSYEDKISYQRQSRWNGLLFEEARKRNLL